MADHIRLLSRVNWDFPSAVSNYGVHGIHWYPASFIPQIPAYLIELFSKPGDLVFDPFAGSGATLVEGIRLGRRVLGMDINPVACLISRAKLLLLGRSWRGDAEEFIKRLEDDRLRTDWGSEDLLKSYSTLSSSLALARPWYHSRTFAELMTIHRRIQSSSEPAATIYRAAFSAILKRASGQVEHWGYVADNMIPAEPLYRDVFDLFIRSLREMVHAQVNTQLSTIGGLQTELPASRAQVVERDILDSAVLSEELVDLVVTSPPYAGVTDYTTAQRLSMYWLGYNLQELKRSEIGARWKRFRREFVKQYMSDMGTAFSKVAKTVRPGGCVAIVIGAPERRDASHSILPSFRSLMESIELELVDEVSRTPARQRLVDRSGTTNREWILVYRKAH
jgi:DNA modification methylase